MQDGAAIHTAGRVMDWFQSKEIQVLEWPS
jgi:hypothetical protein